MPRTPTEKQREIIENKAGLFTVRACPGSGKTYTVAARLHRLLGTWSDKHQGIVVASFTNVAWQEVADYLASEFGISPPKYPHFLGTLDSFINQYIFLPFGHLVMHSGRRPILCGPPHDNIEPIGKWLYWGRQACNAKGCLLNQFTYDFGGNVVKIGASASGYKCDEPQHPCVQNKHTFTRQGYATQSDANYFALQVLTNFPAVRRALAHRFPVFMVDEAQDTSSTQMAILDLLVSSGLNELMLVGDPDQAIYEWREAEPSLFLAKCKQWEANSITLLENWRSSQAICDVASRMSSSVEPIRAVNATAAAIGAPPDIVGYADETQLKPLVDSFCSSCSTCRIPSSEIHILTRGRELLDTISPGVRPTGLRPWRDSQESALIEELAHAKYLYDWGKFSEAMGLAERAYQRADNRDATAPLNNRHLRHSYQDLYRRGSLFTLLQNLPNTTTHRLGDWAKLTEGVLKTYGAPFAGILVGVKRRSAKADYSALSLLEVFGAPDETLVHEDFTLATIHMVKGMSLDAVLVILKRKGAKGSNYVNLFGNGLESSEELRIVYVAITRARRLLSLAVPQADLVKWKAYLQLSSAVPSETP